MKNLRKSDNIGQGEVSYFISSYHNNFANRSVNIFMSVDIWLNFISDTKIAI